MEQILNSLGGSYDMWRHDKYLEAKNKYPHTCKPATDSPGRTSTDTITNNETKCTSKHRTTRINKNSTNATFNNSSRSTTNTTYTRSR